MLRKGCRQVDLAKAWEGDVKERKRAINSLCLSSLGEELVLVKGVCECTQCHLGGTVNPLFA